MNKTWLCASQSEIVVMTFSPTGLRDIPRAVSTRTLIQISGIKNAQTFVRSLFLVGVTERFVWTRMFVQEFFFATEIDETTTVSCCHVLSQFMASLLSTNYARQLQLSLERMLAVQLLYVSGAVVSYKIGEARLQSQSVTMQRHLKPSQLMTSCCWTMAVNIDFIL